MSEHRIHVRLDESTSRQLQDLMRATGQTISGVVRDAIAAYHAQVCKANLAALHSMPKKAR